MIRRQLCSTDIPHLLEPKGVDDDGDSEEVHNEVHHFNRIVQATPAAPSHGCRYLRRLRKPMWCSQDEEHLCLFLEKKRGGGRGLCFLPLLCLVYIMEMKMLKVRLVGFGILPSNTQHREVGLQLPFNVLKKHACLTQIGTWEYDRLSKIRLY
ncbi:hypothetical protein V6N13_045782 [Hibiscus sabdariffa]|uniref:Uncharacterized protein n=1 Tax=Hibiscus sabdariffa TaxID=183260 RepID=A0ABR2BDY6_9ROSI